MSIKFDSEQRGRVSLRIHGDQLDGADISRRLGLEGSVHANNGKCATWVFSTKSCMDKTAPCEEHLEFLVRRIEDKRDVLSELQKEYTVDVGCAVFPKCMDACLRMSGEMIGRIGALHVNLNFYGYCQWLVDGVTNL